MNHSAKTISNAFFTAMALVMFCSATTVAQNNKVLFVISAADTLELNDGEKLRQTGVFLSEFYMAYDALTSAGYSVAIATPNGVKPTIDEKSLDEEYWKENPELKAKALEFFESDSTINNPLTLEKAIEKRQEFIGLVIPGGQGLMVDLFYDKNIPVLLKHFAREKKPTGLICHAPSLLLTIDKQENPYEGYEVNSVSPFEEFVIERFIMQGKPDNRKIARRLKRHGFKFKSGLPKANFAIKDRNLVTSQNPYSESAFNQLYLKALEEYLNQE